MAEREQFVSTPEQAQQKERLSEHQIGDLLAAIGNHEGKALLLLLMNKPGHIYDRMEQYGLIIESQGDIKGWPGLGRDVPFGWCKKSLAPIGLVAKESFDSRTGTTVGYRRTQYGDRVGASFAGHLLDFSLRHKDNSLYELFGSTASSSKHKDIDSGQDQKSRAPLTRYRIFQELVTAPELPIQAVDVLESIIHRSPQEYAGYKENITFFVRHLKQLAKNGIIKYESVGGVESFSKYRLSDAGQDAMPSVYRSSQTLTYQVYAILTLYPETLFSIKDIQQKLLDDFSSEQGLKPNYSSISGILSQLVSERFVEKGEFGQYYQSKITMSEYMYAIIHELVDKIDRFAELEIDFLQKGIDLGSEILEDPDKVSALLERARFASPNASQADRGDTADRITSILASRPGLTINEIIDLLWVKFGQKLTTSGVRDVLKKCSKQLEVKEGTRNRKYYSLTSEGSGKVVFPASEI